MNGTTVLSESLRLPILCSRYPYIQALCTYVCDIIIREMAANGKNGITRLLLTWNYLTKVSNYISTECEKKKFLGLSYHRYFRGGGRQS